MTKKQMIIQLHEAGLNSKQVYEGVIKKHPDTTSSYVYKVLSEHKRKNKEKQVEKDYSINIIKRKRRELFMSDIHIPYHDETALSTAINFALDEKITDIVLSGDIADFKSVSFWERDANERDLNYEVQIVKSVLNQLREAFPNAKIVYIEGNHEERLRRFINSNIPEFSNLSALTIPKLFALEELKIEYVSNKEHIKRHSKPFQIGKLFHIHGHEVKASWGAVNVARNVFLKTQRNVIMGHFHTTQEWVQRSIDSDVSGAWAVGCLSELVAPYQPVNNWNHGFAIIEYDDLGNFTVYNRKIINGIVV